MLEIRNLECVRGDHRLFAGLNVSLRAGELLHVKGSNGSGKTSLLRTLCGLMSPASGEVLWKGADIRKLREDYFASLTYIGHLGGIKDELTGHENLRIACQLSGFEVTPGHIDNALRQMGLQGREDLPTKVLSQGQKRRVALARLLLCDTDLWILDEPFTALDVDAVALLKRLIEEHIAGGGMAVLTTHQVVAITAGTLRELNLDS